MAKIMFNDKYGLTQAVIDGSKTVTRRVIKVNRGDHYVMNCYGSAYSRFDTEGMSPRSTKIMPRYKVGEIVAVAQCYFDTFDENKWGEGVWYKEFENRDLICEHAGWTNKMFVKAKYMPYQIKILSVRVEKLQDISDEDILKEGIASSPYTTHDGNGRKFWIRGHHKHDMGAIYGGSGSRLTETEAARKVFADLIDRVGKKGDWDKNPYVWVYEFELIK